LRSQLIKIAPLASAAAFALGMIASSAPAFADAAPAGNPIQYSGLFDGYYLYQFENPKPGNLGQFTRFYDFRQNTPTLSLAELNVYTNPKAGDVTWKVTLGSGDTADTNGGGDDAQEGRYKALMQAYGTYTLPSGAGFDVGKFYTPIGYEVTESNGNMNETHSIPFGIIPFYHTGLRAYTQSYHGLVITGYVVKAIYNTSDVGVQDNNGKAAFVGNGVWTDPKNKWVIGESVALGEDKYSLAIFADDPVNNKVTVSDTDITYNLNPLDTVAGDYTYAKTDPDGTDPLGTQTDNAWAVYWKHILKTNDIALRYSAGDFKNNLPGSEADKPWEATATYEMHTAKNFTSRIEYQHSGSNMPQYADNMDNPTKKSQDTLEVAGIFTFSS